MEKALYIIMEQTGLPHKIKKMDRYQIPMTSTHKSQMQTILNASQSPNAPALRTIVNNATNTMIMTIDQINEFIVIINNSAAQNKQELVNIIDPTGPTPPIKL